MAYLNNHSSRALWIGHAKIYMQASESQTSENKDCSSFEIFLMIKRIKKIIA